MHFERVRVSVDEQGLGGASEFVVQKMEPVEAGKGSDGAVHVCDCVGRVGEE
jgi:hypothetical protein